MLDTNNYLTITTPMPDHIAKFFQEQLNGQPHGLYQIVLAGDEASEKPHMMIVEKMEEEFPDLIPHLELYSLYSTSVFEYVSKDKVIESIAYNSLDMKAYYVGEETLPLGEIGPSVDHEHTINMAIKSINDGALQIVTKRLISSDDWQIFRSHGKTYPINQIF
ncbi:hypothetical protein [Vibrio sp. 10N.239.312.D08]|uniref:hypothetical protein n=1 Tax=Vibrio sp. 10N.239.312.D08 TaxID=3229978 RepID=UPI00354E386F